MAGGGEIGIVLNGRSETIEPGTSLAELIARYELPERGVAVEVSGQIVPRGRWSEHELVEGDRVELVHMVGGG